MRFKEMLITCFTHLLIFIHRTLADCTLIEAELLWGQKYIIEKLLNLSLEISPATYFRLNSLGAEELCKVVANLADVNENTTVLDLFCGSGCLALTLAKVGKISVILFCFFTVLEVITYIYLFNYS